ncbi:MAG TPA: glycosyltransferase [Acidothermaceae bacterium]
MCMFMDYVLLSTYPPTQCGLATFSAALNRHLALPGERVRVVRVVDEEPTVPGHPEVVCNLLNGSAQSARAAVGVLNGSDVVIVQHEYGIYGGVDGEDILGLVDAVTAPMVTVLHTVLAQPTVRQKHILQKLSGAAAAIVTMTQTARRRLIDVYGVDSAMVSLIPHGAVDNRVNGAPSRRASHPLLLTWGLLGPGKGLEHAIDAVALLRRGGHEVHYMIAGQTHPKVIARDGERYRQWLLARARSRAVDDLVHFDNRFLDLDALNRLIGSADVVVLPYDSTEQVTSGVLIEAVTAGRPVVSTAFPHAVELLASGAGALVPRRDARGLAGAVMRVLGEPAVAAAMCRESARLAPSLLWPAVARSYRTLAAATVSAHAVA